MKSIKEKLRRFLQDDEGMEVMEVAAIALGVLLMVGAIALIYDAAQGKINEAAGTLSGGSLDPGQQPKK